MALTRSELKAVVKELLKEILSEGLGDVAYAATQPSIRGTVREGRAAAPRRPEFDPRLDTPIKGNRQVTNFLKEAIKQESRGNPVMADLLADTAMTTLPTQLAHGDSMQPTTEGMSLTPQLAQQEQFAGDPVDVFGEAAAMRPDGSSHWADLAFAAPDKKST